MTKTLKRGEDAPITHRDVCGNAEIQRKLTPNKRAKTDRRRRGWGKKKITGSTQR